MTSANGSRSRTARTYAPERTVPLVASTPIARRDDAAIAAAAPGRMTPMTGTALSSRTRSSATEVAVLQARTMSLQSQRASQRTASRVNSMTSSAGRGPYGIRASSPRYTVDSFGSCLRSSRRTVRPPTPESKTPIGRSAPDRAGFSVAAG
jgi:hypothetical protein